MTDDTTPETDTPFGATTGSAATHPQHASADVAPELFAW